jgi:hypothetical protein
MVDLQAWEGSRTDNGMVFKKVEKPLYKSSIYRHGKVRTKRKEGQR